jgi:hypothetical protein
VLKEKTVSLLIVCQDSGSIGKQNLNAVKGNDDIYTLLNKKGNYSKKKKEEEKKQREQNTIEQCVIIK